VAAVNTITSDDTISNREEREKEGRRNETIMQIIPLDGWL
jgi:hypothetical protein